MVFRALKKKDRKNKTLFINAANQVRVGRAQNFLEKEHVERIYKWYRDYQDVPDHVKVATLGEIETNDFSLNIPLYVEKKIEDNLPTVKEALRNLKISFNEATKAEDRMKEQLKEFGLLK